jgi:DNA-binding CsgD family transcriptional regulator
MFPQKSPIKAEVEAKTYPLGESSERLPEARALALIALSHTQLEHRIYLAMLLASPDQGNAGNNADLFNTRRLMTLADIRSVSTVRRCLEGLVAKQSIERKANGSNGNGSNGGPARHYCVLSPEEILSRRNAIGVESYPREVRAREGNQYFGRAIERVVANNDLSRREAQVTLCCVEGLTNAEIGNRLNVSEQTVKFHLRHIFIKFGVKRRAELISRMLM